MTCSPVRIIGIPMDLGQSHRGVDMGPSAMRYAGLSRRLKGLGYPIVDAGNIEVPVRYALPGLTNEDLLPAIRKACESAYQAAATSIAAGEIPIFLGGDHSIAIGTIGGVTTAGSTGILWIDAHADFNTPQTSPTGNVHGMALATLLGAGYPELLDVGRPGAKLRSTDVVIIGVRDLDSTERQRLKKSRVTIFTMRDIDEYGMSHVMKKSLKKLENHPRIHVSLDLDSLDPMEAPGVGTPSQGGLTYREAQLMMEMIADTNRCTSIDLVENNPILDIKNQTASIAVDLAASLLGKSII